MQKVGNLIVQEERILTPKQEAELKKQKETNKYRRKQRLKLFFIAVIFSSLLHIAGLPVVISLIPLALHVCLLFYSYAVVFYGVRQKEKWWKMYVAKFGDKNGNIPDHVRMTHKKLIMQGHKIDVSPRKDSEVTNFKLKAVK